MLLNDHSKLAGLHSFLSPSQSAWVNYDEDKLIERYKTHQASILGTKLHEFAKQAIDLGQKLPRNNTTLSMYVNDAIGYRMKTEVPLFYSIHCFGTADALSFRDNKLRIHDLKTGRSPVNPRQLDVYAALFCLEYKIKPSDIDIETRLYFQDERLIFEKDLHNIVFIIDRIVTFNKIIEDLQGEELA